MAKRSCNWFVLVLLLSSLKGFSSLKNVRLKAKEGVGVGQSLHLQCDYDLEDALLYSIKWYFENDEFYRFVPKESPPTRVFPVPGIAVDLSVSDSKTVTLHNVQRDLTGYYKCEVSADAPSFHTDIKSTLVVVVESPHQKPIITTEKTKFHDKEILKAMCISPASYPACNITWFINGSEVPRSHIIRSSYLVTPQSDTLESSESEIDIITYGLFVDGKIRLKCVVWQYSVYRDMTEMELVDDTPQLAHVLSPDASSTSSGNKLSRKLEIAIIAFLGYFYVFLR